ncbi:SDR family NAD(P)-dependent oxidoreductase [Tianweitania sediminis]|uniref:SDR family NAD(P)-dependent oxidoreductase n=1 Tax=Tianweitania sediminis TaxID=1502156 RepID=A0A8J7RKV3_9HYPH|nr:SDR family NAD(P)-dependent oxidoreductase [Tianweitania sediminis]MBP0440276.1 SDR family NAD(P)-dependent oxidoreductase [Tianweitania sediminis]
MTKYRATPQDGTVWVTGASGGIGYALALALARAGYTVAASARSADRLDDLAKEAVAPGRIVPFPLDVTDEAKVRSVVERIEQELGPIALAVLNAGTSLPATGVRIQPPLYERVYDVNLFGVVRCMAPVVERMKARNKGQIAIVGSLTAYFGLPGTAAYGATKAALNAMAESLRFDFHTLDIRIQVINPGFVDTAMTRLNRFPMPGLMTPDAAAKRITSGLQDGGFEVTFPRRLAWPMKAVRLLPHAILFPLLFRLTRWGRRPS